MNRINNGLNMLKGLKKCLTGGFCFVTCLSYAASDYTLQGHLGALSNQVSNNVGNVPGNRYSADFEFDFHKKTTGTFRRGLESRFTAAALVNDQNLTMYSLQEAYVGANLTFKDHLRVGRQILPWSQIDHTWGFGKLNNRRNFNYFTPGEEGLIGLLYERKSSNGMRYRGFVSGLYVPELNPGLDIDKEDRTITTRNPWGDAPASSAEVEGRRLPVKYDVDYPEVSEVIYRYTVGANIGFENKHWVLDNFIIRKPENTLTPNVDVNVSFTEGVVTAAIDPKFYYHDVYGSSLKYRNKDLEMYISGIAIRPNEYPDVDDQVRYTEIKSKKQREDYVGGGISRSNDLYTLAFNYVARLSPFDREKDDLSLDPRWNQAINLFASRNFGPKFRISGDVKFDMLTTDRLVMLQADYRVSKELQMNIGVNMIGAPNDGKSFWSPYTNNDAIYGGLRYVF